jgi:ribosome biogenesis GTPase
VGDNVGFDLQKYGTGFIHSIEQRKNYISRKAPKIKGAGKRGERLEQMVAANFDNLVIVSSINRPQFNNRQIDRLLVAGESSHVNIKVVINKLDLDESGESDYWISLYRSIGYEVHTTSVKSGKGIEELRSSLSGNVNLFWGQSGVGKSSLLNSMFPHLDFRVGEVSDSTSKGKHTTVTSVLKKVGDSTYIIDTPGMREMDPYGIRREDVGHYFREFVPFLSDCRFNTCTHHHEPGCGIMDAFEEGYISEERYQSYLNIIDSVEDDMNF